ncbi:MAG: ABC transporter ATP-binding protein [Planctomycetes bacterium]|nr:ABC transporter ATP-binding protein [Planctomycetota bacterium]
MIQTLSLTKTYDTGPTQVRALADASLTVRDGEFVAIMGPSGSGKSTLMALLGCLDTPTSGEYLLDGQRVSDLTENELAEVRSSRIGFVFQAFHLLPRFTALSNVELPLVYAGVSSGERRTRAEEALSRVELAKRAGHRPNELSGGEKQRVAIARALVNRPKLLLADEPTGNLDSRVGAEIMGVFDRIHAEGATVVMVTHDRGVAEHAERIVHLKDGRIDREEVLPPRS